VTGPAPLLDFFKKGEVARDVRLVAAQGGLATRAHEQLAILAVLVNDEDAEIRTTATTSLDRIPADALKAFLARSDVSAAVRAFFSARGITGDGVSPSDSDEPLVSPAEPAAAVEDDYDDREGRDTAVQRIGKMGFTQRLKAATKGTREMRSILIRDPNRMIAAAVLSSPKLSEPEVESIARMTNVSDEILRIIGNNRAWTKNYGVVLGLVKNPKTPLAMSLNLMNRLNDRDVAQLSVDRNVPEPLRVAARKKIVSNTSGRG
jgi:hypothetical protein